jgi:two-component system chemotaxis sensor kinase CheA
MDDLLAEFLTETNESLSELDGALLRLERTPDHAPTLQLIFRLVHTIKGTCGFLSLPRLERLAHAAENVLGQLREGRLAANPPIVTLVLSTLDRVRFILSALSAAGTEPEGGDQDLIEALDALAEGRTVEAAAESLPLPAATEPQTEALAVEAAAAAPVQSIRVTVDVLDHLMTLVSELVLTRNQLLQLARTKEDSAFSSPLQRLSHITSELQDGVMKTRMQPIGNAWNKLPRLVRDLGRELGKRIDLVMLGAETELDRQVLELIKDPLTHMVRNSADHGLEMPHERREAGKPETGRITLNAFHEGGHIIIEIADDGRGLAVERIRAKVLNQGLATEAELAAMTDEQTQRFIFRAGFSTASAVTAVSGRRVGMDVVKTNIERIGGTIELKSIVGKGTTFTIKIPLTLAIVSALVVEAGGERFAIPQISVLELVHAGTAGQDSVIERINDTPVLRLRDRLLPLVNLTGLLGLGSGDEASIIVVAQVGAALLGIMVDRVFDTEEIVVKPVAPILRHITVFSGNTILGDGSVIMILDPNGIARATGIAATGEARQIAHAAGEQLRSGMRTPMLLFRAGSAQPLAVPLGLVARLEEVAHKNIEISAGAPVVQYRGKLMPLIPFSGDVRTDTDTQPVLVFAEGEHRMGLMVDEIVDVVEDRLEVELSAARPGLLGTAVIGGRATDIVDTAHFLALAARDWFGGSAGGRQRRRILAVEDSGFFRQLLVPALSAAGYEVTAATGAQEALALRDSGEQFDAVISDIEMPGMDGFALVRALRAEGPWRDLPILALSSRASEVDIAAGRDAGFDAHVAKFDREALLAALATQFADHTRLEAVR